MKDLTQKQLAMRQRMLNKRRKPLAGVRFRTSPTSLEEAKRRCNGYELVFFYIVRPDPQNPNRLKFGKSKTPAARLESYTIICPDITVLGIWKIASNMERPIMELLTKGVAVKVCGEVYDITNVDAFYDRVRKMKFQKVGEDGIRRLLSRPDDRPWSRLIDVDVSMTYA